MRDKFLKAKEKRKRIELVKEFSEEDIEKIVNATLREKKKTDAISLQQQITNIELALVEIYEEVLNG